MLGVILYSCYCPFEFIPLLPLVSPMAGHAERCSFVALAFILGEGMCPCFPERTGCKHLCVHRPKKEAVCASVLSV